MYIILFMYIIYMLQATSSSSRCHKKMSQHKKAQCIFILEYVFLHLYTY